MSYTDQQIRDWILKRLPDGISAELEEQLFEDAAFDDRLREVKVDLYQDYARKQLDARTRADVERQLLGSEDARRQLRFAEALDRMNAGTGARRSTPVTRVQATPEGAAYGYRRRLGYAAAALAAAVVVWTLVPSVLQTPTDAGKTITVALSSDTARGAGHPQIGIPGNAHDIRLQLEVDRPTVGTRYRLDITGADKQPFDVAGLVVQWQGAFSFVETRIPAASLAPGAHTLTLVSEASAGDPSAPLTWNVESVATPP